ncbi:hypothetical protein EVAR_80766_1 [Eumeta japonica]|uniref:Uncharacterized protein n=1 Tax=Eumeta variegata TaxID=151549 RepID=A0A4C1XAS4_EUMVA|nr:hypothetical protein EVAR_80766_1 [Eumeta japonica]
MGHERHLFRSLKILVRGVRISTITMQKDPTSRSSLPNFVESSRQTNRVCFSASNAFGSLKLDRIRLDNCPVGEWRRLVSGITIRTRYRISEDDLNSIEVEDVDGQQDETMTRSTFVSVFDFPLRAIDV